MLDLLLPFFVSLVIAAKANNRNQVLRKAFICAFAWSLWALVELPGFFENHNINLNRPDAWQIVFVAWLIRSVFYAVGVFAACGIVWLCRKPTPKISPPPPLTTKVDLN